MGCPQGLKTYTSQEKQQLRWSANKMALQKWKGIPPKYGRVAQDVWKSIFKHFISGLC